MANPPSVRLTIAAAVLLVGCQEPTSRDSAPDRVRDVLDEVEPIPDELRVGADLLPDFSTAPGIEIPLPSGDAETRYPQDGLTATWLTPSNGLLTLVYEDFFWNYWIYERRWGTAMRFSQMDLDGTSPWVQLTPLRGPGEAQGTLPWQSPSSITAGWVNEDHGFFSIMAKDRAWGMCMPNGGPSCGDGNAYSEHYAQLFADLDPGNYWKRLAKAPDEELGSRWPFEGPGISAGWYDARRGLFWVISDDSIWGAHLDDHWSDAPNYPNYFTGHIASLAWDNPLRKIHDVPGPKPWDSGGPGITATWYNPVNAVLTIVSGSRYWSIATDDDDDVLQSGVLGKTPEYVRAQQDDNAQWCGLLGDAIAFNEHARLGMFVGGAASRSVGTTVSRFGADVVADFFHHQLTVSHYRQMGGVLPLGLPVPSNSGNVYAGIAANFSDSVADWYGWFGSLDLSGSHPVIPVVDVTASGFGGDSNGDWIPDVHSVYGASIGVAVGTPDAVPPPWIIEDVTLSSGNWEAWNSQIRNFYVLLSGLGRDVHLVDADAGVDCPSNWPTQDAHRRCVVEFGTDDQPHWRRALEQWRSFCALPGMCTPGNPVPYSAGMTSMSVALLRDAEVSYEQWCG